MLKWALFTVLLGGCTSTNMDLKLAAAKGEIRDLRSTITEYEKHRHTTLMRRSMSEIELKDCIKEMETYSPDYTREESSLSCMMLILNKYLHKLKDLKETI